MERDELEGAFDVPMVNESSFFLVYPTNVGAERPVFELPGLADGYVAKAGTPPGVVDKLHRSITEVLNDPEIQKKMKEMDVEASK
jgi:hypothetical protein